MKKFNPTNRIIPFANIAALTFTLGSPIAAEAVENLSLSELSAQIENLTRKLHTLHTQVNEQHTETHYISLGNNEVASPRNARAGLGRNKNRSRQIPR